MLKKSKILHDIRQHLTNGCLLSVAIDKAGVKSRQTIQNWRVKSPRIDRYIIACMNRSDDKRVSAVEDKAFQRLIAGEANAAEYIFYLTNRRPERWKDRRAVVNNTNVIQNTVKNGDGTFAGEDGQFVQELRDRLAKKGIK